MKINKVNNSLWEITADQLDGIRRAGIEICEAAFSDVGEPPADKIEQEIHFKIRFNGLEVEFITKRELYMFGLGLQLSADAIPIQLIGKIPAKAKN